MALMRVAVGVVVLALVCSACMPRSSGDLDVRTGCTSITAERTSVAAGVVMNVRAAGCPGTAATVDHIAATVWRSLRQPVDEIRVEVSGGGSRLSTTALFSRATLSDRFGGGPSGPVVAAPETDDADLWLLLPIAWIVAGFGALLLVYRAARAGAVFLVFR
ncbi:hypothetical protein [Pseudonocardia sediminis]|nr:hypothetical protein [Pseudonocardia sediminis]